MDYSFSTLLLLVLLVGSVYSSGIAIWVIFTTKRPLWFPLIVLCLLLLVGYVTVEILLIQAGWFGLNPGIGMLLHDSVRTS